MEEGTKVIILRTRSTDTVPTLGLMAGNIWEDGKRVSNMEKVTIKSQQENTRKVFGITVRELNG